MSSSSLGLRAGELLVAAGRLKEAQLCSAEAASLGPHCQRLLLQRGRLAELRGHLDEAQGLYDEALAIQPAGELPLLHVVRQARGPSSEPNVDSTLLLLVSLTFREHRICGAPRV